MASLFRDFSFDPASQRSARDHKPEHPATSVSPTWIESTPLPIRLPTPPLCSVAELTETLDQQSLHLRVAATFTSHHDGPLTPPSDTDCFPVNSPPKAPAPLLSTTRINSATLRMQRQANVRMQCSSSHVKDITAMVEKMVETNDQCNFCERKPLASRTGSIPDEDDEGVDMNYTSEDSEDELRSILPSYRAYKPTNDSARVSKNVRMRRRARITKIPLRR